MVKARGRGQQLPDWARVVVPQSKQQQPSHQQLSDDESSERAAQDDAYLRTRCYHAFAARLHEALYRTLESTGPNVRALLSDEASSIPTTASSGQEGTDGLSGVEEQELATFTLQPPTCYDPRLLPVLLLEAPLHHADRHIWMHHLVQTSSTRSISSASTLLQESISANTSYSTKPLPSTTTNSNSSTTANNINTDNRTCVVWLRGPDLYSDNCKQRTSAGGQNNNRYQIELVRQCLQQEPETKLVQRCSSTTLASYSEIVLDWASRTRAFDELWVFCEPYDPYARAWTDWLQWMVHLRHDQELPISLILLAPGVRRPIPLGPSVSSHLLRVRRVPLPRSHDILDGVWKDLRDDMNSIPIPDHVLSDWRHVFQFQKQSAVHALEQMKRHVAQSLAVPGSFLSCMAILLCRRPHESLRITSLFFDQDFRRLVGKTASGMHDWLVEYETKRLVAHTIMTVQSMIYREVSNTKVPYMLQSKRKDLGINPISKDDRYSWLAVLATARKDMAVYVSVYEQLHFSPSESARYEQTIRDRAIAATNEIIVLLDQCHTIDQAQNCLVFSMNQWTTSSPSPLEEERHLPTTDISISIQPRRDHVNAMLHQFPTTEKNNHFNTNIPGYMYRIIQDRVNVSENDWFLEFRNRLPPTLHDNFSRYNLFELFGCGIRHLQVSGLIRVRRVAGKNEIVYEKTALVWCGGD